MTTVTRVREVPGVGFEVQQSGKDLIFFQIAEEANAEARTLHEIALAFHELGKLNGKKKPTPTLELWPSPS